LGVGLVHLDQCHFALVKVYWCIRSTDVPPAENPNFLFEVTDQWMIEVPSKQKLMPTLGCT
jgi:phage tail sheath protein FI